MVRHIYFKVLLNLITILDKLDRPKKQVNGTVPRLIYALQITSVNRFELKTQSIYNLIAPGCATAWKCNASSFKGKIRLKSRIKFSLKEHVKMFLFVHWLTTYIFIYLTTYFHLKVNILAIWDAAIQRCS